VRTRETPKMEGIKLDGDRIVIHDQVIPASNSALPWKPT
jgi:hypothetical protein